MKENNYIDRIGRSLPYKAPDGFFDALENNVLDAVRREQAPRPKRILRWLLPLSAGAAAACVAILLIANANTGDNRLAANTGAENPAGMENVEYAFSNLSSADQQYLLSVYSEDLFMDE